MTRANFSNPPVVIIGAGHAGAHCATALRRAGYDGPIRLVGAEEYPPYDRPPLSKAWIKGETTIARLALRPAEFYEQRNIALILARAVVEIAPDEHRLRLDDDSTLDWSTLILAPGAAPRPLPAEMMEVENEAACRRMLSLRELADARSLKTALTEKPRLLIIGGGYIGLEVAASARSLGLEVTVVEATDMLMPRLGSPEVSRFFAERHAREGVEIHLSTRLARLNLNAAEVRAEIEDGGQITADFVLVGIGAMPRTELAEAAGIACDDGILVDDRLHTSASGIFAVGDAARVTTRRYGPIRLECIQNANESAEVAARVIAGDETARYDPVPWFWSEQYGIRLQSVGLPIGEARRLVRGRVSDGAFSVLHLDEEGRLLALDSIATSRDFIQAKKLIAAGTHLDEAKAADPGTPLKEAVRKA